VRERIGMPLVDGLVHGLGRRFTHGHWERDAIGRAKRER